MEDPATEKKSAQCTSFMSSRDSSLTTFPKHQQKMAGVPGISVTSRQYAVNKSVLMAVNNSPGTLPDGCSQEIIALMKDDLTAILVVGRYYRCACRLRMLCMARAYERNGIFTLSRNRNVHNHPPPRNPELVLLFRAQLRNLAKHSFMDARSLYDEVIQNFPEIAQYITFHLLKSSIDRWQAGVTPPIVNVYPDVQREVETDRWAPLLRIEGGNVRLNCITAEDNVTTLIYGNPNIPQNIPMLTSLSFTISPLIKPQINNTEYIMSVSAVHNGILFTFAWALLNRVSRPIFKEITNFVKTILIPNNNITTIYTGLDADVRDGIQDAWAGIEIASNLHQYALTLLHHAHQQAGIELDNEQHVTIVKKLIVLALLPPIAIPVAFHELNASIVGNMREAFGPFLQWFAANFITNVDPATNSFFQRRELLNDETMKESQQMLALLANVGNPGMWLYYKKSLKVITTGARNLRRLNEGQQRGAITTSPRVSACIPRMSVSDLWRHHENGLANNRFLMVGATVVNNFVDVLLFRQEYVQGPFSPRPVHVPPIVQYVLPEPNFNHVFEELNFDQLQAFVERPNAAEMEAIGGDIPQLADVANRELAEPEDVIAGPYNWLCVKCNERVVRFISRPCNCIALCEQCKDQLRQEAQQNNINLRCPNCTERVNAIERVYFNAGNDPVVLPYEWKCQICATYAVSYMGLACKEVKCCDVCVEMWRNHIAENPDEHDRCAICNAVGPMVELHLRRH